MGNEGFSIDYFLRHQCKGAMDTHPSFSPHRKDIDSIFKEPKKKINQNLKNSIMVDEFKVGDRIAVEIHKTLARLPDNISITTAGSSIYGIDQAGADNSLQQAIEMTRKGGKISILAFYKKPITADISTAVRNGINLYTIRGE